MHKWIIDAENVLSGDWLSEEEKECLSNKEVAERFDTFLEKLQAKLSPVENPSETEKACLTHFLKVSTSLRPRLISCYDVPGLPRTNNDMEGYIRSLKTRYRRISGRKNWNAYLLRYGQSIAYFDSFEQAGLDENALFTRLTRVNHQKWREARNQHRDIQSDRLNVFRFRRNQDTFLHELEARWEQTLIGT